MGKLELVQIHRKLLFHGKLVPILMAHPNWISAESLQLCATLLFLRGEWKLVSKLRQDPLNTIVKYYSIPFISGMKTNIKNRTAL